MAGMTLFHNASNGVEPDILENLTVVSRTSMECWCELHRGDMLFQVDATLPDGTPIRILKDKYMYYIAVGSAVARYDAGSRKLPKALKRDDAKRRIQQAIRTGK